MKSPATYTREDMVEINCHGGTVSVRQVLGLMLRQGARLAEPGEFTRRAFLNGRIDLAQAEAVMDVISSLTEEARKAAMHQLQGGLSQRVDAVRQEILDLTALVEAHIDFPDEDLDNGAFDEMKRRASAITDTLNALSGSAEYGMILREGLRTAIVGRPNVGKSSLLNALLEHDRAIVTDIPGTTRDSIEECLNIQGLPLRIIDTAGIRDVSDIAEQEGVRRSLSLLNDADMVILMLDRSEPLHETDLQLMEKTAGRNAITVANKCDLPDRAGIDTGSAVLISAKNNTGIEDLRQAILEHASGARPDQGIDVITNVRHLQAVNKALSSIKDFTKELDGNTSPELLSVELRDALDYIGHITGATAPEDILNRIFSTFCIGK